jgi:hypothetical protein
MCSKAKALAIRMTFLDNICRWHFQTTFPDAISGRHFQTTFSDDIFRLLDLEKGTKREESIPLKQQGLDLEFDTERGRERSESGGAEGHICGTDRK